MNILKDTYGLNDDVILVIAARLTYSDLVADASLMELTYNPRFWEERIYTEFAVSHQKMTTIENMYRTDTHEAYLILAAERNVLYPGVEIYLDMKKIPSIIQYCDDPKIIQYFYGKSTYDAAKLIIESLMELNKYDIVDTLYNQHIREHELLPLMLNTTLKMGHLEQLIKILQTEPKYGSSAAKLISIAIENNRFNIVQYLVQRYGTPKNISTISVAPSGNLILMRYLFPNENTWINAGVMLLSIFATDQTLFDYLESQLSTTRLDNEDIEALMGTAIRTNHRMSERFKRYQKRMSTDIKYYILFDAIQQARWTLVTEILKTLSNVIPLKYLLIFSDTGEEHLKILVSTGFDRFLELMGYIPLVDRTTILYNKILNHAVSIDNIDVIIYALNNGADEIGAITNFAAIKYLQQTRNIPITNALITKYLSEHTATVEAVQYLFEQATETLDILRLMRVASIFSTPLILVWMFVNYGLSLPLKNVLDMITMSNNVSFLLYLLRSGRISVNDAKAVLSGGTSHFREVLSGYW